MDRGKYLREKEMKNKIAIRDEEWGVIGWDKDHYDVIKYGIILLNSSLFNTLYRFENPKLPLEITIHVPQSILMDLQGTPITAKLISATGKPVQVIKQPKSIPIVDDTTGDILNGILQQEKDGSYRYHCKTDERNSIESDAGSSTNIHNVSNKK